MAASKLLKNLMALLIFLGFAVWIYSKHLGMTIPETIKHISSEIKGDRDGGR